MADIFISKKEFCIGKSTKTYEERIQEKDLKIEKLAQELKRYEAQKKQLEKRKKVECGGKGRKEIQCSACKGNRSGTSKRAFKGMSD